MLQYRVRDLPMVSRKFKFLPKYKENEYIGVEFEVEGLRLPTSDTVRRNWSIKNDGSLRVPEHPEGAAYEYVLSKPVSPSFFLDNALPYLNAKFKATNAEPMWSVRCSTHIHVGVHELYLYQAFIMGALYCVLEELFLPLLGENRDSNLFCLDTRNSHFITEALTSTLCDCNSNSPLFNDGNFKYTAVNFLTLCRFGTLEFRGMEGTMDKDRLRVWIQILDNLRDYASKQSPSDCLNILNTMSAEGPLKMFADMIGGRDSEQYKTILAAFNNDHAVISGIIYNGIGRVQSVFYEPNWLQIKLVDKYEPPKEEGPKRKGIKMGNYLVDPDSGQVMGFAPAQQTLDTILPWEMVGTDEVIDED